MKLYRQQDKMDCGPTCIRMAAAHYRRNFSLQRLRNCSGFSKDGVSLLGIADAAKQIGFILLTQFVLLFSRMSVDYIRSIKTIIKLC